EDGDTVVTLRLASTLDVEEPVQYNVQYEVYNDHLTKLTEDSIALTVPTQAGGNVETKLDLNYLPLGSFKIISWIKELPFVEEEIDFIRIHRPRWDAQPLVIGMHVSYFRDVGSILARLGPLLDRKLSPGAFFRWVFVEPEQDMFTFEDEYVADIFSLSSQVLANFTQT